MARRECVVKKCGGGQVQFGLTGQSASVYLTKHQLCVSSYQDGLYGAGQRVHNPCGTDDKGHFRCTVCGAGHGICRP